MARIKWNMDPAHSEVVFKVRHMMVSNVSGEFKKFDATLETEGHDFTTAKATFEADVDSITTRQEKRDEHLKSEDFFHAEKHPKIHFESTEIKKVGDDEYEMLGNMTIRETTKPIVLKVENSGVIKDPWGYTRAGFEISGKINRLEYGLKYNAALETGGVVVGSDVKLLVNIEMLYKEGE